ncbi:hypothetical protein [uncultured Stenotrophomonas sp.]|uniref:hypothetical protein n=1 Tax=uncultured Stenotrophomonas sp. TaxID=165438 RepID=UPI0025F4C309|nr:hypothetical protein [uncultured Stenotrophomonas sp.]
MTETIDPEFDAYLAKLGPYENPPDGCPNCGRSRVMVGDDGLHRCEKCCWCIEEGVFDRDMLSR